MEILADVLMAAGKGARKTKIMQEANLSHELLQKYLAEAMSNAFLKSDGLWFSPTEKGQKFLEQYTELHNEHSKIGSSLRRLKSRWEALERTCQNRSNNDHGEEDGEKEFDRKSAPSKFN